MTSLVELQQLYWRGLTKSVEFVDQKRCRTLTFHTLAERHGALLTISRAGEDTPSHYSPIPVTAIAAQFLRNEKHKKADRESTRLASKEVTNNWRTPMAASVSIFDDFTAAEFAAKNTKQGKAPRPDSISGDHPCPSSLKVLVS